MDNQSQKQDKQFQIPMIVTDETIRDFGIKPEAVTWRRLGNRKCRVVMVDATEEEYKAYMEPIWTEIKREDRDGRCMVKGKNGTAARIVRVLRRYAAREIRRRRFRSWWTKERSRPLKDRLRTTSSTRQSWKTSLPC